MASSQFTILNDLPKFKGNKRPGESHFQPGINVKTFFRTLDNYFRQQAISHDNDQKKLQVLYALIDKEQGNAIDLVTCYAGKDVRYEDVKAEFLFMYPNFTASEYRHAARTVLESNIANTSTFCGMTKLETQTQALVESYLANPAMTKIGLIPESEVMTIITPHDDEAPQPGPYTITVPELLQNFSMHLIMSNQLPNQTYDKIANITPNVSSTRFMSLAVQAAEKQTLEESYRRKNNSYKKVADANQVIFQVQQSEKREQTVNRTQKGAIQKECFRCGDLKHLSKQCRVETYCSFCKLKSHNLKACRKRKAQGKYCSWCKRENSHDTKDCYSAKKITTNVMEESQYEDPDRKYEDTGIQTRNEPNAEYE